MTNDANGTGKRHSMVKWLIHNKRWLFSGIGVFILSGLLNVSFRSTKPPSSIQPDPLSTTGVVEAKHDKGGQLSGGGSGRGVPLDNYAELFDGYLYYFVSSLGPNSVEHVISDDLIKYIVADAIHVDGAGEIYLSVSPWNYAALFDDQVNFSKYRGAVSPSNARAEEESQSGDQNSVDQKYYQLKDQIRANLRSYFSDRGRLESFYRAKKALIQDALRGKVPTPLRSKFLGEIDKVIESFEIVLTPSYRRTFDDYLSAERGYIAARYGPLTEEEMVISLQNVYDQHDGSLNSVYPDLSARDRAQAQSVDHAREERLTKARQAIFDRSPNAKAAAFAYRRYLEGGEELVEGYIHILKDLRASVFIG
jgi:hypothetical protein